MHRRISFALCVFVAIVALRQISWSEDNRNLSSQASAFLRQAAQDDLLEQKLGEYAATHASTTEVKNLGKQIAQDHRDDLRRLQDIGRTHNLKLPEHDDLTLQQKSLYDRLTANKGLDFDKQLTKFLVQEHRKSIPQLERERDHAADPAVRNYVSQMLPSEQKHLDAAKKAEKLVWGM